jgi:PAS domain S-box-containing protein
MEGLRGGRRAALLVSATLASASPLLAQSARIESDLPTLTSLAAVRSLDRDEASRGYPVRVRAVVTHISLTGWTALFVDDGTAGIWVDSSEDVSAAPPSTGDLLEIEASTREGDFAPVLTAPALRVIGRGRLPQPARAPYYELATGRFDSQWIEIEGIVKRIYDEGRIMGEIAVPGGAMQLNFGDLAEESLPPLVDARVRLRGACGTDFTTTGQLVGVRLFVGRLEDVVVLEPAPEDPFALEIRPLGQVLEFSATEQASGHRIHVRGVVTVSRPGRFLTLQDATGAIRVESTEETPVEPGDVVDAVGFPTLVRQTRPFLSHATYRRSGRGPAPEPGIVEEEGLVSWEHDATLVRIGARLLGTTVTPDARILTLSLGENVFSAELEELESGEELSGIVPGSEVQVTGVYAYTPGPPSSFRLYLRGPKDVVVTRAASWWRLRHTLVLAVSLLLVAAVGAVWVRFARRKSVALEEAHEELRRAHEGLEDRVRERTAALEHEVAERRRAEEESQDAAEQARKANAELVTQQQAIEREIEERRRLEEQAGSERDLLRTLIDTIPDRIYFKDRKSRFLRVNAAQAEALGLSSPREATGRTDLDFFSTDFARGTLAAEQELMASGTPQVGQVEHDPGSDRWYLSTRVPTRDGSGEVVGLVGLSKDITESKRQEKAHEKALAALMATVGKIAEGDLTQRATEGDETLGRIGRSVNQMLTRFSALLADVRAASDSVASSSSQILATAREIARSSQRGTEQVLSTSTAVDEMAASMSQVARNAARSAETAASALDHVRNGEKAVEASVGGMRQIDTAVGATAGKMRQLEQRSREVFEITELIEELAAESNLLALNAAIEAAHAGDAGRGFGVVAEEIRRLADRSQKATRDVTVIVEGIVEEIRVVLEAMGAGQREIAEGQELSKRARGSLGEIQALVERSADLSGQISGASTEQTKATHTVAEAMQEIAEVAERSASGSRETSKAVRHLVALSEQLAEAIGRFRTGAPGEGGRP